MKFSDYLWETAAPIYQKIIEHPFNFELAKGTLEKERFLFYMEQDAYYLISFSKALALIAGRSNSSKMIQQFLNFSLEALIAERSLHISFLSKDHNSNKINPSFSCLAYTQHLVATAATASLEDAIAAVLPCFWVYREVGNHIAAYCSSPNPYKKWIETYSSPEFSQGTDLAICLLDEHAEGKSAEVLKRMQKTFDDSFLLEWHFWNDAYHGVTFRDFSKKSAIALNHRMK